MNGSFSKPKLVQVGLVVRDLDKTMQQFKLLLGAEPDRVIEKSPSAPGPKYYLGQERDFYQRAALYSMNGIEFEILQPYNDRSALTDFLDERGEGIHHVAFDTDNSTPLPRIWPKTAQSLFRPGQTPGTLPSNGAFSAPTTSSAP